MKKENLTFALFLFSLLSYGQIGNQDGGQVASGTNFGFIKGDHLPDSFLKSGKRTLKYEHIQGTPYIDNKQVRKHDQPIGKLYTSKGKYVSTFFMRYNAYTDNMELSLLDDGIDYFLLKKKPDAWYAMLGNNKYRAHSYNLVKEQKVGFFTIISEDDNKYCTILKKENITFKDQVAGQNAFITPTPARFIRTNDTYFIKIGNSVNLIPKKKKDFLNLFVKKKEMLKKYLDNNKYKLTREKDLISIVNYYNTILL